MLRLHQARVEGLDDAEYPTAALITLLPDESGAEDLQSDQGSGSKMKVRKRWAALCYPMASGETPNGRGHGFSWAPNKGDIVWVGFVNNDVDFPVVMGGAYDSLGGDVKPAARQPESLHTLASDSIALCLDESGEKMFVRGEPDADDISVIGLGKTEAGDSESKWNTSLPQAKADGASLDEGFIAHAKEGDLLLQVKQGLSLQAKTIVIDAKGNCTVKGKMVTSPDGKLGANLLKAPKPSIGGQ